MFQGFFRDRKLKTGILAGDTVEASYRFAPVTNGGPAEGKPWAGYRIFLQHNCDHISIISKQIS